ncbi:MAG TPA: AraC family transcriptional regulator [Burkholderiaceae bacterium]|nr:AraC family transcriptional regulator [Burkholderiaceae bacterium]
MSDHAAPVAPQLSIRSYSGEQTVHEHGYAQVLFAWRGRMDIEVGASADFSDSSCGLIIPAGVTHAYAASPDLRMVVIDAPPDLGLDRARRFPVTAGVRALVGRSDADDLLAAILGTPRAGVRRGIALDRLQAELAGALHEPWTTARMAERCLLSPQRFHARLLELTGQSPQAWLRALRLDAAQRLLKRGLTLEAVAARVGYATASALAHALRRDREIGVRALRGD